MRKAATPKPEAPPEPQAARPAAPPIAPPSVPADEAAFMKRIDAAIAPVRDYRVGADDLARVKGASAKSGDAKANEAAIADPSARKLAQWLRLRSGKQDPVEVAAFVADNPSWPEEAAIVRRMEERLFVEPPAPSAIKSIFDRSPPKTAVGRAALATAHLALGDKDAAREATVKLWRTQDMPAAVETTVLQHLGSLLSPADHQERFDWLIADDPERSASRRTRAVNARHLVPLLPPENRAAATAKAAAFLKAAGVKEPVAEAPAPKQKAPAAKGKDTSAALKRAQQLRRTKKHDDAVKLVLDTTGADESVANPDGWWKERRALAYDMLKANRAQAAYDLVSKSAPLTVNPLKEQTFLAGWIAFRYLKNEAKAKVHFADLRKAADGPLSRAKAGYWLGRVAEGEGDQAAAKGFYETAAREKDTFHGQLSAQKLNPGPQRIDLSPPKDPTPEQAAKFAGSSVVRAAVIAHKAGFDTSMVQAFLYHLAKLANSEPEAAMVAHLAEAMGDTQTAVRIAKSAVAKGYNLVYYGYPVHPFPAYTPLRKPPETAFLLGVARQETEFNTLTVSTAGAKGLLQVMTVTAKHVCRDYNLKCEIDRVLKDKPYNTMLASAYIADRMGEFSGSYVLALAGYNAGPGRAREWIKAFGDPRDPKVDPIDWIERIPFQETREYVAKVLSNIQIYRARIDARGDALRLEDDLVRGRPGSSAASGKSASIE